MLAARTDSNQAAVVSALRQIGASVQSLHRVGYGVPDLLVGYRGLTMLLEVKDGDRSPSARMLTADEREWHAGWSGHVAIVGSPEEAQIAVIEHCRRMGQV